MKNRSLIVLIVLSLSMLLISGCSRVENTTDSDKSSETVSDEKTDSTGDKSSDTIRESEPQTETDPEVETETVYIIDDGNGDVTYLPDRRPGWENGLPMLKETDDRWQGRDPGPLLNKIDMYLYEEMVQGKDSYIAELSVADREAFLSGSGAGLKYLTDVTDPRKALVAEMTKDQIFDLCEDDAVYSLSFYNARLSLGTLVVVPVYISREEFYESYEYFTGMKYEEYESLVDHYRSLQESLETVRPEETEN